MEQHVPGNYATVSKKVNIFNVRSLIHRNRMPQRKWGKRDFLFDFELFIVVRCSKQCTGQKFVFNTLVADSACFIGGDGISS